jgi:hypothetical protein
MIQTFMLNKLTSELEDGDEVKDSDIRRTTFTVEGMDCADEVRLIEDKLGGAVQYRER